MFFEVIDDRRVGVGHVPPGAVREERQGAHLQGRQRRGAQPGRDRAAEPALTRPQTSATIPLTASHRRGGPSSCRSGERSHPGGAARRAVRVVLGGATCTARCRRGSGRAQVLVHRPAGLAVVHSRATSGPESPTAGAFRQEAR